MNKVLILIIKCYQRIPGNIHKGCKFYPSCSNYAIGVLENFNLFKALFLIVRRLFRCHPFRKYSYDPIPQKKAH